MCGFQEQLSCPTKYVEISENIPGFFWLKMWILLEFYENLRKIKYFCELKNEVK